MTRRQQYRQFLKTPFWLELSARKKALNPKCERCGSGEAIQAHHKFYRGDWNETQIEDLETLCEDHHLAEHGLSSHKRKQCRYFIYRSDSRFNRFIHWVDRLFVRLLLSEKRRLKSREILYLQAAIRHYPPTKKDTCMKWHVEGVFQRHIYNSMLK